MMLEKSSLRMVVDVSGYSGKVDATLDIFRSVYQPSAYAVASAACYAADDGTALVTYD